MMFSFLIIMKTVNFKTYNLDDLIRKRILLRDYDKKFQLIVDEREAFLRFNVELLIKYKDLGKYNIFNLKNNIFNLYNIYKLFF
jgi:hypothetical protein